MLYAIYSRGLIGGTVDQGDHEQIERSVDRAFAGRLDSSEIRRITFVCFREFWREMVDWVPTVGEPGLLTQAKNMSCISGGTRRAAIIAHGRHLRHGKSGHYPEW